MADEKFTTVDEIDKAFGKLIKDSDDEAEQRELRMKQREAIADFREAQAAITVLRAHKASVVSARGLSEWEDMVTGDTPEEIEASAAKIVERLAKLAAPGGVTTAEVEKAYGAPGTGAGGANGSARKDETAEKLSDFERRFNDSTRGSATRSSPNDSQATITEREATEYARTLLASRAVSHLAKNSYNPDLQRIAGRIDPATLKERV